MSKSPEAFRTISEVAEWLGIQAHVLRFWESKFSQVKPVKRAGGRRYYRPNDMLLLGGIKELLYEDGLTIKGAQKVLREKGVAHVATLSPPLDEVTQTQVDDNAQADAPALEDISVDAVAEQPAAELSADPEPEPAEEASPKVAEVPEPDPAPAALPIEAEAAVDPELPEVETAPEPEPETPEPNAAPAAPMEEPAQAVAEPEATDAPSPANGAALPAFLRRPAEDAPPATDNPPPLEPVEAVQPEPEPEPSEPEPPAAKPRDIGMPPLTPIDQIAVRPGLLTAAAGAKHITPEIAREMAPYLDRLDALRNRLIAEQSGSAAD